VNRPGFSGGSVLPSGGSGGRPPDARARRWNVAAGRVQPAVVEPVDPFQDWELDLVEPAPGAAAPINPVLNRPISDSRRRCRRNPPTEPTEPPAPSPASRSEERMARNCTPRSERRSRSSRRRAVDEITYETDGPVADLDGVLPRGAAMTVVLGDWKPPSIAGRFTLRGRACSARQSPSCGPSGPAAARHR
jgi:hypothetical protein